MAFSAHVAIGMEFATSLSPRTLFASLALKGRGATGDEVKDSGGSWKLGD